MYHVLVGVDEDEERARACAQEVLNLPGDTDEKTVTLLHSFTDNPGGASATQIASVRRASDFLDEHGIDYEVLESSGDPAESILDAADELNADLVVVGGRKRSPAGKAIFGSVTQSVILSSSRPVMVTGVVTRA
ncbi:universal stress protein [Haloprofundus salilacus]|uniref:universal stress protein n=1 Tax=Haloprofundus salilacus TaxID=2876190 RepID=UPI001CC90933|nr:universal stress protein [Haloprofundus salilacus]